jgi:acetyl esterase/lipase
MRRLVPIVLATLTAACTPSPTTTPSSTVPTPSTTARITTSSPPASTTSSPSTTAAVAAPAERQVEYLEGVEADVYLPSTDPSGVVLLVHGGAWVGGDRRGLSDMAKDLAGAGYLTVNATYRTSNGGYPTTFEDVACAVRFARQTAADEYGAELPITVIGHSAGAHIGALISLGGESFAGECPWEGAVLPDAFVGLAGPYDITQMAFLDFLNPFFGAAYADDPTNWDASNPYTYIGENSSLQVALIHGDADREVSLGFSENFEAALEDASYDTRLEVVADADHFEIYDPDVTGDLITQFLATVG